MKSLSIVVVLWALCVKVKAQETIQQTIFLKGNGVNSTEILMYKQDNINYNSVFSNSAGFGIYNSSIGNNSFHISAQDNIGIGVTNATEKLSVK